MAKERAIALYRASSKQQTDRNNDFDIPLQKEILRPFIQSRGWELVKEFVEGGISGFKVSAEDRDAVQEIKQMAVRHEFDVLVIYMSDRLGRISDETPLIISFLNSKGIQIISYTEGEIKSTTHTDKLLTYIRYWQAEGESLKTSARVSDAITESVKHGRWRGGNIPYGYHTVSRGTLNFKGKPVLDVEIDEEQADVVRKMFYLSRVRNYGIRRIATYLNDKGIVTQKGGKWCTTTVIQVLTNTIYKGYYTLYDKNKKPKTVSPHMPDFQIVSDEDWDKTQDSLKARATRKKGEALNTTHGKMLLSGLVYCGTCGKKLTTLAQKSKYTKKSGELVYHKNYKYICSSFFHPSTEKCTGQTTYSARKLETMVLDDIREFLCSVNHKDIIETYLANLDTEIKGRRAELKRLQASLPKLSNELNKLKEEIIKILTGNSTFTEDIIKELLLKKEKEIAAANERIVVLTNEVEAMSHTKNAYVEMDDTLTNWAEKFDNQTQENKKAMLLSVIDRVNVYRDRVEILYDISINTFLRDVYDMKGCFTPV
jgi:DNA invertase Pin-like site-specific DNA recombinase